MNNGGSDRVQDEDENEDEVRMWANWAFFERLIGEFSIVFCIDSLSCEVLALFTLLVTFAIVE